MSIFIMNGSVKTKTVKNTKTTKRVKTVKQTRPTFYLDTDKTEEVRAGGILFYKYNDDMTNFDLLLINSRNNYEDFGGCTDNDDENILDTVAREVEEESNKIFKKKFIMDKIKETEPVYIKHCKYALYFIELDEYYDPVDFGDREIHDNIARTVEWVSYDSFSDQDFINKLNFRLKSYNVLNYLKKINIC